MQQSREYAQIDHPLGKKLIFQEFLLLRVLSCEELIAVTVIISIDAI